MPRLLLLPVLLLAAACSSDDPTQDDTELVLVLPDEDGDTIMDHQEGAETDDLDGDGTPNFQDLDSDADGIDDAVEAGDEDLITLPWDSDADAIPDFLDTDSDANCIEDAEEGADDIDADSELAYEDLDDDGDGLLDQTEIGDACDKPDHDGDDIPDYQDMDSDGDGIGDLFEGGTTAFNRTPNDTDGDGTPDYLDDDSDGDGFSDADEAGDGEPWEPPADTDADGVYDFADTDSDNDGLSEAEEVGLGTDPYSNDTDGDGFTDGSEIGVGTDPLDPLSVIEGIYVVVPERTDVEEVFEFELSIKQADIGFIIDTTGSMGSTVDAMASQFGLMVTEIAALIPDAEYGVAQYDDYNYGTGFNVLGSGSDKPFILLQQITSDQTAVQTALDTMPLHGGGDIAESGMEALYQALSGNGYDQDCLGSYTGADDVKPFIASAGDAFGGAVAGVQNPAGAGGGDSGGMGFRDYALPILVYATDAALRDDEVASYTTPGGCSQDAGQTEVVNAATDLGAYLIGVAVNTTAAKPQMNTLADLTGSFADLDADGVADDRLVFEWDDATPNAAFRTAIVGAIEDLANSVQFEEITLEIEGDDEGFVVAIDPMIYNPVGAVNGDVIEFTLTFRGADTAGTEDELHELTLNVIGDGTVLLDTLTIYVLVPGSTL